MCFRCFPTPPVTAIGGVLRGNRFICTGSGIFVVSVSKFLPMPNKRTPTGKTDEEQLEQSKEAFLYYFKKNGGNISRAIESVRTSRIKKYKGALASRSSYYRWCNDDPVFAAECDDIDEANIDEAETCVMDAIKDGDTASAKFILKTKGKKRGYVERTEITGAEGLPHRIEIVGVAVLPPVTSEEDVQTVDEIVIPE